MPERIGMVGLGLMGQAMIHNLIGAGFAVQGFDIDPARLDDLRAKGGTPVDSPAEAARDVDLVLLSLPNSDIVREVVTGPGGILETAHPGLYVIDTTTSRPSDSANMAAELAQRDVRFLDAAVSGTSTMAQAKDLIVIAGGAAEDFEACRELLAGFSRAAHYMGPPGSGAMTKLIINLVLAGNRFALMEGLLLGTKAGVDGDRLLTVLKDGAAGSKAMDQKGAKLLAGDYTPQGALAVSHKDNALMLEQGREHGVPLLITSLYAQLLNSAYDRIDPTLDSSVVYEVLRELGGLPRRA